MCSENSQCVLFVYFAEFLLLSLEVAQGGKQSSEKHIIRRLLTSVSVKGETGVTGFLFRVFVPVGFFSAFQNCSALLR